MLPPPEIRRAQKDRCELSSFLHSLAGAGALPMPRGPTSKLGAPESSVAAVAERQFRLERAPPFPRPRSALAARGGRSRQGIKGSLLPRSLTWNRPNFQYHGSSIGDPRRLAPAKEYRLRYARPASARLVRCAHHARSPIACYSDQWSRRQHKTGLKRVSSSQE